MTPARHPADTVTVVLFDTVDLSHAPWGRNREERFVFSHLYETLVTINCRGEARTGPLTKSVIEASDGWLIELKETATFWDGGKVTAQDVVESFRGGHAIKSVDVVDDRTVLVHGHMGRPDITLLSLPMFAIRRPTGQTLVPLGTGPWVIDESAAGEDIIMSPASGEAPVVRFIQSNVSNARDMMDAGTDAMITDDPASVDYAHTKESAALAPLAWDRVYLFLSPSRERRVSQRIPLYNLPASVCESLARDAVDVDARGGSNILSADELLPYTRIDPFARKSLWLSGQIVYPKGDLTAQQLAERIVALARSDTSSSADARALARAVPDLPDELRTSAVDERLMNKSLSVGQEFGYILPISWTADFPRVIGGRLAYASFLFSLDGKLLSDAIIPLIETRAHFMTLSDRIGFVDDHAGNVRIMIHTAERRR